MAAGTLSRPTPTTTEPTAPNRIDEHDADYARLHSGTQARLTASIRRYVRDLRAAGHDAHRQMSAAQAFIQRHTKLLREAYAAGWREGLRDYYAGASASKGLPAGVTVAPDEQQQGHRLSFYAPSVAKMATEGLRALQAEQVAKAQTAKLTESVQLAQGTGGLADWQQSVGQRVALQAEIIWPALNDGYSTAGGQDSARPFSQLWWQLGPVKTDHCADCPWVAYNSPYDPPGSGGNELAQSPGDGATECGAACKCTLSYGGWELPQDADWAQYMVPPDAPFVNAPVNPGQMPAAVRQQGRGQYLPAMGTPIGVDANGDYVYAGTPEEQGLASRNTPRPALYGTIDLTRPGNEPFTVDPIAASASSLSMRQLQALDAFRAAWSRWNTVRGGRPAARSLFGYVYDERTGAFARPSATAGLLVPRRNPAGFAPGTASSSERFAQNWSDLTPSQQRALADLYRAIVAWDTATRNAGGADGQQLSEADGATVALYDPAHDAKGRFDQYGNHGQHPSEGNGREQEHEANQRGGGGGAKLGPAQRAKQEQALIHERQTRERVANAIKEHDAWLSTHEATHVDYQRISDQRLRLKQAHDTLSDRITARETTLGVERTARPELSPMPRPGSAQRAGTLEHEAPKLPPLKKSYMGSRPYRPQDDISHLTPEQRKERLRQQNREAQQRFHARHPERQKQYLDLPGAHERHLETIRQWGQRQTEALRAARAKPEHERTAEDRALIARHRAMLDRKAERKAERRDSQQLMEMADDVLSASTITLSNDNHSDHGRFTYTGGPGSQGGHGGGEGGEQHAANGGRSQAKSGSVGHEEMQRESSRAMLGHRAGGTREGANLAPHQRQQMEQELTRFTAQRDQIEAWMPKADAWLASHGSSEPRYSDIAHQRLTNAAAHEKLQGLIENRQQVLGHPVTARHTLPEMPKPLEMSKAATPKATQKRVRDTEYMRAKKAESRERQRIAAGKEKGPPRPRLDTLTPEERAARDQYQRERNLARQKAFQARKRAERQAAAADAANTQQLMEMGAELIRESAVLLDGAREDQVLAITLFDPAHDAKGRFDQYGNHGQHVREGEGKGGNGQEESAKGPKGKGGAGSGRTARQPRQSAEEMHAAKIRATARAKGKAEAEGVKPGEKATPVRHMAAKSAKATDTRTPEEKLVAAHQAKIDKARAAVDAARQRHYTALAHVDAEGERVTASHFDELRAAQLARGRAERALAKLEATDPLAPKAAAKPRTAKTPEQRQAEATAKADRAAARKAKADAEYAKNAPNAQKLQPVREIANWATAFDIHGAPNAHALRALYGDSQLEAALGRHSLSDLRDSATFHGLSNTGSKAALVKRISAYTRQVSEATSVAIAEGQHEMPKGMAKARSKPAKKASEDRVWSITLTGGHDQGYEQNRKSNGQWDVGDGGEHSGYDVHYVDEMKELRAHTAAARGDHETVARVEAERESNRQAVRDVFGRDLADHEIAGLVGARRGDRVLVERTGLAEFHLTVDGAGHSFHAERQVRRFSNGMIVMRNDYINVIEQGHGLGAEILARQVAGASRLGVSRIDTTAARRNSGTIDRQTGETLAPLNGYDTWAKLGYEGDLPRGIRVDYGDQLRAAGLQRGTVQELMRITEPVFRLPNGRMVNGQELWKLRGDTWNGNFDLTPGSRNRQVLRAYLERKGRQALADELQLKAPTDGAQDQGEEIEWTSEDDEIALEVWRELDAKWKREEAAMQGHREALDD